MIVGDDGRLPLPWLEQPLTQAIARSHGHALLIHGSGEIGVLELAAVLAQSALCDSPLASGIACGRCGSCRLVQGRAHADLLLLMPEELRQICQWPIAIDKPDSERGDDGKPRKKASRQIRIEEVRMAIDWTTSTPSRGRVKLLVVHPADALNPHAASALLKTLEEPPGAVRIILTASDPARLLPTIRSRCRIWTLPPPDRGQALRWLESSGVADAPVLLAARGGRPLAARALADAGVDAATWQQLPQAVVQGQLTKAWPLAVLADALLRLCHDLARLAAGGTPLYFDRASLPPAPSLETLIEWHRSLLAVARQIEHPWQEALLIDRLMIAAQRAVTAATPAAQGRGPVSPRAFATLPA